jgi:hypothetical protein
VQMDNAAGDNKNLFVFYFWSSVNEVVYLALLHTISL